MAAGAVSILLATLARNGALWGYIQAALLAIFAVMLYVQSSKLRRATRDD